MIENNIETESSFEKTDKGLDKDSNNMEFKLCNMAEDTVIHKKIVLDICLMVSKYLIYNNEHNLAIELLKRGCEHDNSKFDTEEFRSLAGILKSRKCFTDATSQLSSVERNAIKYHWQHNRHHPEYFQDKSEMTELDMLEMVCDWYARSKQYNTEFISFVIERQHNRFHFEPEQFEKILKYCRLVESLDKVGNTNNFI